MRRARHSQIAGLAALAMACSSQPPQQPSGALMPGRADLPLALPCAFASGVVTVVLTANETATLALDGSNELLVNGQSCGGATASTARRVAISVQDPGTASDETVILDGTNGFFALGASTGGGITVTLGAGTSDAVELTATSGNDTVLVGHSASDQWLVLNQDTFKDVSLVGVERLTVRGAGGDDVLNASGLEPAWPRSSYFSTGLAAQLTVTLEGGAGNDSLTGGALGDTLRGGLDADVLLGSAGDDLSFGDEGDDAFEEGAAPNGADIFNGGDGTDTVRYGGRSQPVTVTIGSQSNDGESGEGDDVRADVEGVTGGSAADSLTCSVTTGCTLRGGGGGDLLTGNTGPDTLHGEAGDDVLRGATGNDVMTGGDGVDLITYSERTAAVTVVLGSPGTPTTGNGASGESDSLDTFEAVVGGTGNDSLSGNELDNRLTGGAGNDTLSGGGGDDVFDEGSTGSGQDVFSGGAGVDRVDYGARTAALAVSLDGVANDGLAGELDNVGSDVEAVTGGSGNDTLTGSEAGAELFDGMAGDDTLSGLGGNDTLSGGPGNDTLLGGAGDDILEDIADGGSCDCGPGFDIAICDAAPASCEVR